MKATLSGINFVAFVKSDPRFCENYGIAFRGRIISMNRMNFTFPKDYATMKA